MLEIEYRATANEAADATMDFLANRPLLNIMFFVMRISCFMLCFAFCIALYHNAIRPQDIATVIIAAIWIRYYKPINRWIIKGALKRRKFDEMKCLLKMDEKSILYRIQNFAPHHIEWKKLKFILKNKNGYIVPLTGLTNAGRFMWLPLHCFANPSDEQFFLDLVSKHKLKIKPVKK